MINKKENFDTSVIKTLEVSFQAGLFFFGENDNTPITLRRADRHLNAKGLNSQDFSPIFFKFGKEECIKEDYWFWLVTVFFQVCDRLCDERTSGCFGSNHFGEDFGAKGVSTNR